MEGTNPQQSTVSLGDNSFMNSDPISRIKENEEEEKKT